MEVMEDKANRKYVDMYYVCTYIRIMRVFIMLTQDLEKVSHILSYLDALLREKCINNFESSA